MNFAPFESEVEFSDTLKGKDALEKLTLVSTNSRVLLKKGTLPSILYDKVN